MEIPGQIVTKFFRHPLDPNIGATFDGEIWTCYVPHKHGGTVGEWRLVTKYKKAMNRTNTRTNPKFKTSARTKEQVSLPVAFTSKIPGKVKTCSVNAGRFTLECFLGRTLETWEVCRHGIGGPDDHSYLNVSPGDAVNNMIDDLENGKSETSLTYLIQAQQRLARLISSLNSTKPTNAPETLS